MVSCSRFRSLNTRVNGIASCFRLVVITFLNSSLVGISLVWECPLVILIALDIWLGTSRQITITLFDKTLSSITLSIRTPFILEYWISFRLFGTVWQAAQNVVCVAILAIVAIGAGPGACVAIGFLLAGVRGRHYIRRFHPQMIGHQEDRWPDIKFS